MERRKRPKFADVNLWHDQRDRNRFGPFRGWRSADASELEVDLLGEYKCIVFDRQGAPGIC
jgi:hypothetical protein